MCGLVGIAGKLEYKDEATMKRLLVFDYFRGPDSTGFAALRNDETYKVAKIASNPIDLFDMKKFQDALSGHNSLVFLGHNRLATKGGVNNYNAHPYSFPKADGTGDIVGAHNGTLDHSSWKALEAALGEIYEVDSMAVIACIAKLGIEATVPLLQGAWALVWFDTSDNTVNFLRNKERPLWYAYTEDFNHLFWASEWATIHAAVNMAATPGYKLYEKEGYRFWSAKEDWWYKFDLADLKDGFKERPKPRVKELKGKEPTPAYSYHCAGTSPFQRKPGTEITTHSSTPTSTTTHSHVSHIHDHKKDKKDKESVSVLHLQGTKVQPFGEFLTKEEFDKIAKYGCSWCQTDVEYEEPGVQVYTAQDMVLCPTCAEYDIEDTNAVSRVYVDASRLVC